MENTYAVVVYLEGGLARLVDGLRAELNPQHAGKAAHISVLPPRRLCIAEDAAMEEARNQCAEWEPFVVEISGPGTFFPVNGVVYLEVERGAPELQRLHVALNDGLMSCQEPYPYVPHITISQEMDEARTYEVMRLVSEAWAAYRSPSRVTVEALTFVRLKPNGDWEDLAQLQLGRAHVRAS